MHSSLGLGTKRKDVLGFTHHRMPNGAETQAPNYCAPDLQAIRLSEKSMQTSASKIVAHAIALVKCSKSVQLRLECQTPLTQRIARGSVGHGVKHLAGHDPIEHNLVLGVCHTSFSHQGPVVSTEFLDF